MNWNEDDGPSDADLDRFSDEANQSGFCPDCGAACWDEVEFCPNCSAQIGGRVLRKPKVDHDLQRRFTVIVVVAVLIGFVLWALAL